MLEIATCGWIWLWFHRHWWVVLVWKALWSVSTWSGHLRAACLVTKAPMALWGSPFPPDQVTLQASTDRSTVSPLEREGPAFQGQWSTGHVHTLPSPPGHHQQTSLVAWRGCWVLSFLPLFSQGSSSPSLLHLVKRSTQACFCFYLNLAPMPMSNSSQREGLLLSGTRKISQPSN